MGQPFASIPVLHLPVVGISCALEEDGNPTYTLLVRTPAGESETINVDPTLFMSTALAFLKMLNGKVEVQVGGEAGESVSNETEVPEVPEESSDDEDGFAPHGATSEDDL
jgi:hypothetical protein